MNGALTPRRKKQKRRQNVEDEILTEQLDKTQHAIGSSSLQAGLVLLYVVDMTAFKVGAKQA